MTAYDANGMTLPGLLIGRRGSVRSLEAVASPEP